MKKLAAFFLVFLMLWSGYVPAQGEEEARSLKSRIKSVSSRLYYKDGRMELMVLPLSSISLNDSFYQKFGGGLGLAYHLSESFAIQAMGTYSLNVATDYAVYHGAKGKTDIPYAGKRSFLFGADFCWAPLYGKVSLAAEYVMHFDTFLMGGLAAIGGDLGDKSNFGLAGSFGLGMRFFFSRNFALRLELKDYMVFDKVKIRETSEAKSDVQHQLLFNLGLSIFFLDGSREN